MASLRTFNSVGGFSVGEVPTIIILPNGDITTSNGTFTANVNSLHANVTGNVLAGNVKTDHLLYANGLPWDLQQAAGANNQIQYNLGNDFAGSSNLTYDDTSRKFSTVNIDASGNIVGNTLTSNALVKSRVVFVGDGGQLVDHGNLLYNSLTNTLTVNKISTSSDVTVGGNLTVQGTLTSIQTSNTEINDNTIILNKGQPGSGVTNDTSGIEIDRGAGDHATLLWTDSANAWVFKLGTNYAQIKSGMLDITGNANVSNNINVIGNVNANNFNGNLYGNVVGNLTAPGNNTEVLFNDGNVIKAATGLTFNKSSNLVTLSGNISVSNVTNVSNVSFNSSNSYVVGTANALGIYAAGINGNVQLSYTNALYSANLLVDDVGIEINVGANYWKFGNAGNFHAPKDIYANTGLIRSNTLFTAATANIRGDAEFGGNVNVASTTNILGNLTVGNSSQHYYGNITGNLFVGENASVTGNISANNLQIGNYVSSNLTATANTYALGTTGNRWKEVWLTDSGVHIGNANISVTGNVLYLTEANIANINTVNIDASGYVNVGTTLTVAGISNITNTTVATSTTSGAFKVAGGVGIGGNIYVGGLANIAGNVLVSGNSNANITGNLVVGKDANVGGNLAVTGNLVVSGSTTYINVTNLATVDPLIDIGGSGNGANVAGPVTGDRGLHLRNYYSMAPTNQFIGWKTANSEFQLLNNVTVASEVVTGDLANLRLNTLIATHIQGTVDTANQPNIANLTGLYNATVANLLDANVANITTLNASGLKYPRNDGTIGQVIKTDGAGNLSFTTIETFQILNGTSNVYVNPNGNVTISVGGTANVLKVTTAGANISGNLDVTANANVGNLLANTATATTVAIGNTKIRANTVTTTSTSPDQVIADVSATGIRGIDFLVKGEEASGAKYSIASVSAVHNGTDVAYDVYGTVSLGGYTGKLKVTYSGGNLQLVVTPASSNSTVWTTQFRSI